MDVLIPFTLADAARLTRKRSGEIKLGEVVSAIDGDWVKGLEKSNARFVILGIPEDVGVRANYGRAGAGTAFKPALESFLNQQANLFIKGEDLLILGEIAVADVMEQAEKLDLKNKSHVAQMRELVITIDKRVQEVITAIITLNKIPIIIGGGHNNAYGNIKGSSIAKNKKVNVINCDPHLDFRPLEGRHSGNGFSYAFNENYIHRYSVFAMHEQYNSKVSIDKFQTEPSRLFFNSFESIFVREESDFSTALNQCIGFVKDEECGIEIDLDAITNVPTSAKTSSGITPLQARQYAFQCAKKLNCLYFHIAEGAPVLSHIKTDNKTGKLISYLITDFIKGIMVQDQD